jgi:phosphatidylserine decarboxylase
MSVFNVHVNRIPFSGSIRKVHYNPGKYFAAFAEKASLENEQTAVLLDTDKGFPILFVQIAGLIARRIICRLQPGDQVERGERYGLIRFGSRADIYFPDQVKIEVKVGQVVEGGRTVLGRIQ